MIYLNNASTTYPKPEEVCLAVEKCIRESGWSPERNTVAKKDYVFQETREFIAELINAPDSNQIIFTFNATEALNLAIKGFAKKGDHVIITSLEHNSVVRPLKHLEQDGMIELSIVNASPNGSINLDDIVSQIKNNTRLIVTTHVPNALGNILPVEKIGEIAMEHSITYLVDCSQSIGVLDIDVQSMHIDMLAFPGHKSLYGPPGTGALYIRKGIDLVPIIYGGTGNISEPLTQPEQLPYKYESGTPNNVGISGLNAGIKFILRTGIEKIREYEEELMDYMYRALVDVQGIKLYGPEKANERVGIISLNLENKNPMHISKKLLDTYGILTRPGLHCAPLTHQTIGTWKDGTVRFSVSYFNTKEEIDSAIKAIREISKE